MNRTSETNVAVPFKNVMKTPAKRRSPLKFVVDLEEKAERVYDVHDVSFSHDCFIEQSIPSYNQVSNTIVYEVKQPR